MVRNWILVGTRFSSRPWGPPSLLYNGYRIFPCGKVQPGRTADHSPTSSAAVMEEYSYTFTHPVGHTRPVTGLLYLLYKESPYLSSIGGTWPEKVGDQWPRFEQLYVWECSENMKQLRVCSVVLLRCGKFKKPMTKKCNQLWKLRTNSYTIETVIF